MRPFRIALVSRDPDFAQIYGVALRHSGFEVLTVENPDDVTDVVAAARPDAVIVDFPFPTRNGRGVTELLRHDDRTAALPIVAITARATEPEVAFVWDCGVARVLVMPVSPSAVARELAGLLPGA